MQKVCTEIQGCEKQKSMEEYVEVSYLNALL